MYFIMFFSELTQIVADVIADPTLPRTEDHPCPRCGHKEAVFFQSNSTRIEVSYCTIQSIISSASLPQMNVGILK
jgi:hypothetical protein